MPLHSSLGNKNETLSKKKKGIGWRGGMREAIISGVRPEILGSDTKMVMVKMDSDGQTGVSTALVLRSSGCKE